MANTSIDNAAVEQFSANINHAHQQKESRLKSAVYVEPLQGVTHYFEKLAAASATSPINANLETAQGELTPNTDPGHTKRQVQPLTAEWGTMAPWWDVQRMLLNPSSAYVTAGSRAIRRQQDSYIIAGMGAAALDIAISGDKSTDLTTSVALPAAQIIDADDTGTAGMTLSKLIQAKEVLDENEVDEEGRFIAIRARQLRELLEDTTLTSSDYNTVKALVRGEIDTYLGFTFIRTQLLTQPTSNDTRCYAWHRDSVGLAENMDLMVRVQEDPTYKFNTRVYVATQCNAVRIHETGVVAIDCYEAP